MDDEGLFTIGALADRTGVPVKTIRFYSDRGLLPPTGYSPAGYRRYDRAALARLELIRTLRALDIDLATVRRVLARETSLTEVAAAHAQALDVQIRVLRLRRAVLRAVAARGSDHEEMDLMHELVSLSDDERCRVVDDFIDDTFGRADADPAVVELLRATMPELPDEPTAEQAGAWMDLVRLIRDEDFRNAVRRMAEYQANQRADGESSGLHHDLGETVRVEVERALTAGIDPDTAAAGAVIDALATRYAETFAEPDDSALREWMLERLTVADDPRVQRYWDLVAIINGWPPAPDLAPVFAWFAQALRAHPGRSE